MKESIFAFIKEQFPFIVVTGVFVLVFLSYMATDPALMPERAAALKELWQGLLYAFLALLGVRPRPGSPADRAAIGSATTETGDIVNMAGPAEPGKDTKTQ